MQKKYRLKNGRVFSYLHRKGDSCANKLLVLVHAASKYPLKVGFIVSKKVGKAVVRNKVRRRLREAFRALIPYINDNVNYIVIARQTCSAANFEEIANNLLHVIIKSDNLAKNIDDETIRRLKLKASILEKAKLK